MAFNSNQVEYCWKLDGLDKDWNPWTQNQNATYANLPPGDYTFMLKARDYYDNESELISYKFTIDKAFWHTTWFRAAVVLFAVIILFGIYKQRTIALKKRQRDLEETVKKRTEEINHQKEEIEAQQIEILQSITYAKRIQEAILPKDEYVRALLPDAFIFYRPKDIVAGDFYWIEKIGDEIFIAAADCTGHGVPGAMTSVVCSNALNQAILQEGILDPGKILDRVTELVVARFKHGNERVKDGMDIALCRWNKSKGELIFAGAFNPLWKYSADNEKAEEFEANKRPVGKFQSSENFVSKKVSVKKGDRFYIFSDGYSDQFGGPSGKKFKSNNLKLLLGTLKGMSPQEQHRRIETVFDNWRGNFEQLDDICVIGVCV
jgi:serine phosphatase RsbU (regulator of sigma subunit)